MVAEKRQAFTVRLDLERHEWVRRQAYERRVSMQRIIEEAIDVLRRPQRS
jgi:predicted HicB family RNase H-like nuclease